MDSSINGLSQFQVVLAPAETPGEEPFLLSLGRFQGQTNALKEKAFLDLEAGEPNVAGFALVDLVGSSDYIFLDASRVANIVLCIKPEVPVHAAGVLGCKGGADFSTNLTQNHNIGIVGQDLTGEQCESTCSDVGGCGRIESPNQTCKEGTPGEPCRANAECDSPAKAGNGVCGLGPSTCTEGKMDAPCQADADCDTDPEAADGVCNQTDPHPGVCNGPLTANQLGGDTGPGELIFAPVSDSRFPELAGFPAELTVERAFPCGNEGPGDRITFAFTSGRSRCTIENFSNMSGVALSLDSQGENFSCADWTNEKGPGRVVLSAPALHQNSGSDVITSFAFDGNPAPTPRPTRTRTPTRTPTVRR